MSQNPTIDPGTESSSGSGLKPQLATALSNLEVHLDQELIRYRRIRSAVSLPKQSDLEKLNSYSTPPVDSIDLPSLQNQPDLAENSSLAAQLPEELSNLPGSVAEDTSITSNEPISSPDVINSVSSIVPMKVQTENDQTLASSHNSSTHPDDYLESSEALLRSLQTEQAKPKKSSQNQTDSLLSPLGIGSMLLLLLASLTLGYVVLNPQSMPKWDISKIKLFNLSFLNNRETTSDDSNNSTTPEPAITPIEKYPNLAASEFPEVNDPNDVVGLKPKAKPTPTPTTVTPPPVANITPRTPIKPVPLPSVTPKATTSANTVIQPSSDGYYYLIVDNKGTEALASAQKVVPDAYLSNGKKYIYLGALETEAEAKKRLQELKEQGIKARVRQP
ncbi:MAG: hypothetical protein F6K62_08460 [Sphaerospermopsis sp. SIO1G2]|nr:hypothetical protein [Sphaerospermopsis sp. SIO1G2]